MGSCWRHFILYSWVTINEESTQMTNCLRDGNCGVEMFVSNLVPYFKSLLSAVISVIINMDLF